MVVYIHECRVVITDNDNNIIKEFVDMENLLVKTKEFPKLRNYRFELSKKGDDDAAEYYLSIIPLDDGFTNKMLVPEMTDTALTETAISLVKKVERQTLNARLDQGPLVVVGVR